jgi:hypothetical protein
MESTKCSTFIQAPSTVRFLENWNQNLWCIIMYPTRFGYSFWHNSSWVV